jgi:hypothetical protein
MRVYVAAQPRKTSTRAGARPLPAPRLRPRGRIINEGKRTNFASSASRRCVANTLSAASGVKHIVGDTIECRPDYKSEAACFKPSWPQDLDTVGSPLQVSYGPCSATPGFDASIVARVSPPLVSFDLDELVSIICHHLAAEIMPRLCEQYIQIYFPGVALKNSKAVPSSMAAPFCHTISFRPCYSFVMSPIMDAATPLSVSNLSK